MRYALITTLILAGSIGTADAQPAPGQITTEAVAAMTTSSVNVDDPWVFLDASATVHVGSGFEAIVRPYARRLPGGDWDAVMYQLQVRYQTATAVPVRVDAGIITSPLGLGTLELRSDLNPMATSPSYYFTPLPRFDAGSDRVQLMSGGYPLGAMVSVSGERWDARGGVTDGTPARSRKVLPDGGVDRMPQVVAGGGVTLRPGLRVGTAFATGAYRHTEASSSLDGQSVIPASDPTATVLVVEGEYAFGFTRISGEWVRDRFEATGGRSAIARGFYLQAVQTLTPRLFAAGRVLRVSSPLVSGDRVAMDAVEITAGYRVTRDWIVKSGYQGTRRFGGASYEHVAVGSLVWSARWFR